MSAFWNERFAAPGYKYGTRVSHAPRSAAPLTRRAWLTRSASLTTLLGLNASPQLLRHAAAADAGTAAPPPWNAAAFAAQTLPELLQALQLPAAPRASAALSLSVPELVEDGGFVPLSLACSAADVRQLHILVEHNPALLAASFTLGAALAPAIALRVKMNQSAKVFALAVLGDGQGQGQLLLAQKVVQITQGGCGQGEVEASALTAAQAWAPEPIKIRAQRGSAGDATVRALMRHPMESGQRKTATGQPVPAWFIQSVSASLNGQTLLQAQWGPAVSRDPFLQFSLRQAQAADRLNLSWADNRSHTRSDQAPVL